MNCAKENCKTIEMCNNLYVKESDTYYNENEENPPNVREVLNGRIASWAEAKYEWTENSVIGWKMGKDSIIKEKNRFFYIFMSINGYCNQYFRVS